MIFFQLPPANKYGNEYVSQFAHHSKTWEKLGLRVCCSEDQRRQTDAKHLHLLKSIRQNKVGPEEIRELEKRIQGNDSSLNATKLYTHNVDVYRINKIRLAKINEKGNIYHRKSAGLSDLAEILYRRCLG